MDIINDLKIGLLPFVINKEKYSEGLVHEGFLDSIQSILEKMLINLMRLEPHKCSNIYITGHSKGGALATLMGMILSKKLNRKVITYTYGSPRIGNATFKNDYNSSNEAIAFSGASSFDKVTTFNNSATFASSATFTNGSTANFNQVITFDNANRTPMFQTGSTANFNENVTFNEAVTFSGASSFDKVSIFNNSTSFVNPATFTSGSTATFASGSTLIVDANAFANTSVLSDANTALNVEAGAK